MELLERHFDTAFDAPDGIKRLRELILTLAMQGKLVPQNPNDPPGSEQLKEIEAEKKRLVKQGKIKEPKPLPAVSAEEIPYALPRGWQWVRLGDIVQILNGRAYRQNELLEKGTPVLRVGNLFTSNHWYYSDLSLEDDKYIDQGDLIYAWSASFGPFVWTGNRVIYHYHIWKIQFFYNGLPNKLFLFNFLLESTERIKRSGSGIAMIHMTKERMEKLLVPLPPVQEQERISTKIDELMARCDALEKLRAERDASRLAVHTAAVRQLLNVADTEMHIQAREFLGHHFGELYTVKENVTELRNAILQLAVKGKLVSQDPSDKHSSKLLRQIQLQAENKESFPIPASWIWVRVSQVAETRLGKMLDKAKNTGTPRRYLRNTNVRWFDFDLSDVFEMRFRDDELEEFALRAGDVLICEGGEPGRAAVWDEREQGIYFQKAIHRVRFPEGVKPHFFLNALRESVNSGRLSAYFTGVGIKHLTGKGLSSFTFPLPPLAEQQRIVAKIDQLMSLCDTLEQQIDAARKTQSALLNAVMAQYGGQQCA